jgi:hypothetical protein
MKLSFAHKIGASVLVALSLAMTGCLTDDDADEGPSISTNPSDQSVAIGQLATFTVVASGTGSLTYQWTRNDAVIAGATAASYSVTATSLLDGSLFKCKVTDTKGTTTSSAGILNILASEQTITLGAQNNVTASSLDLDNWVSYTAGNAPAQAANIDIVFAYATGTANTGAALYSPHVAKNGVAGSGGFIFMESWTTTNNTDIRVVEVANWATVTSAADIRALYDAGTTPDPAGRVFVLVGTTVVARSNLDLYVLLRVDAVVQAADGTISITGKAKR